MRFENRHNLYTVVYETKPLTRSKIDIAIVLPHAASSNLKMYVFVKK